MNPYCKPVSAGVFLTAVFSLTACNVDVRRHEAGKKADVDITTPVGDVSVRTNVESPDTGLAVYPGARPLRDEKEPESAAVNVGNATFGVRVTAAKFESSDAQEQIIDFYRSQLQSYGEVTECRGDVDFRNRGGVRRPVCRERPFERNLQLVAGPEEQQHIVSVKPRGTGTEFALVYVQTRGKS
jgi:hypothetical protein